MAFITSFSNFILEFSVSVPLESGKRANNESDSKIRKERKDSIVTLQQWFNKYGKPISPCKPFPYYGI
jgi:hypothetical protein